MSNKRKDRRNSYISDFYCVECGKKGFPLSRKVGQQREPGHLKKIYCLNCKKETNHAELRPFGKYTYEKFKEEFELGRFVDGKRVPVTELQSCRIDCYYNNCGKCWNANKSYPCEYR